MGPYVIPDRELPLRAWSVGLLRVEGARSTLARTLAGVGAQVLALPTLSVRALPDAAHVRAHLVAEAHVAAWVFVSPAAVRFAWRAWPDFAPTRDAQVFAVGPGTAAALSRRGVAATHPAQHHNSEGLLAMPELDSVRGAVALVKAPGGRALLADGMRARGMEVHEVATYRRAPARWDRRHRTRLGELLLAQPRALLLATSSEALGALIPLAGQSFERILRVPVVVSSARLSSHATALGFCHLHIAAGTTAGELVAAAIESARHAEDQRGSGSGTFNQ